LNWERLSRFSWILIDPHAQQTTYRA
jgi:hypothetical protein